MPTELVNYLVHHYFSVDGLQYRAVSARNSKHASLFDSFIEQAYSDSVGDDFRVLEDSRLEHPTRWSSEDRAAMLTVRAFNKSFIGTVERTP